jgi:hypothetical protein
MAREGLAVLAAILIAFALDATRTDWAEGRRTDDILGAMVAEFAAAEMLLDSIRERNQQAMEHVIAFVRRTAANTPTIPDDSLAAVVDFPDEG